MKPRLFIAIHYLEIGGAETSLIGLLQSLDPERVEVDLFLYDPRGEMLALVPDWVNLLPAIPAYTLIERPMKEALLRGHFRLLMARLKAKWQFRQYVRRAHPQDGSAIFGYVGKEVSAVLPSLTHLGEYDLAISFVTPHNIVRDKVKARRKVCWIHTDYSRIDVNSQLEQPVWDGYDRIVSISPDVTRSFCTVFPSLANKIVEIENILSPAFVRARAEEIEEPQDMPREEGQVTLLTIGRYSYPKKLEEIPGICRLLIEKGCNVKWYIIGYGGDGNYITSSIRKEKMEHHVIMLGKKDNPYPYIKACDWYVQPSRYEGKSVTVREAQILQKPVIITDYPTASSQVRDRIDGVIVPMPVEQCAAAMAEALKDSDLKSRITDFLSSHDCGNMSEVSKLYQLLP